jgi:hypothetical protein
VDEQLKTGGNGEDPLWRRVAYWGIIGSFFAVPLAMLGVHLAFWNDPKSLNGEFKYVADFHKVLAGLLVAILGLNSWDRRNGTKK